MTRTELQSLFRRERARFARVYPWVAKSKLVILERRYIEPNARAFRDLAYADLDTGIVAILSRALELPRKNLTGLLRHELGHLSDLQDRLPGAERRADRIAAKVTGVPVRYDARDVQTIGPGKARRPRYLHR